jgi:hypothetical protein
MYTHQKLKTASDVGKRARGGTRTGFYPLQTLGTPENVANPAQSGRCTTRSEVLCLWTWVTFLYQDIGDASGVLGGDTSAVLMGG